MWLKNSAGTAKNRKKGDFKCTSGNFTALCNSPTQDCEERAESWCYNLNNYK